jgi:hypothetical protein
MIRLTEAEKKTLEKEARKEKTSMSDLIRRRALNGATLESINERLKTIEASMKKGRNRITPLRNSNRER